MCGYLSSLVISPEVRAVTCLNLLSLHPVSFKEPHGPSMESGPQYPREEARVAYLG